MVRPLFHPSVLLLIASPFLLATGMARAESGAEPRYRDLPSKVYERTVSAGDLDLDSDRDVRKLYRRLHRAARVVCDAQRSFPPDYIKEVVRPCVQSALHSAVMRAGSPALTAYHERQSPGTKLSSLEASH